MRMRTHAALLARRRRALHADPPHYPDHEWVPTAAIEVANCYASLNQPDRARTVLEMFKQRFGDRPEAAQAAALMQRLEGGTRDPLAP